MKFRGSIQKEIEHKHDLKIEEAKYLATVFDENDGKIQKQIDKKMYKLIRLMKESSDECEISLAKRELSDNFSKFFQQSDKRNNLILSRLPENPYAVKKPNPKKDLPPAHINWRTALKQKEHKQDIRDSYDCKRIVPSS